MRAQRFTAGLALAFALIAAGCAPSFVRRPPEKQRFLLQLTGPTEAATPLPGVVRVERVRVSPVFDSKGFVYRIGDNRFENDFYNEFFAPPGLLVQEVLLQWLAASRLFASIDRNSGPGFDWLLETDLERIYGDRRTASAPQANLAVTFRLVDVRRRKVAFEKRYELAESAASGAPGALVDAWNRELARLLGELGNDVRAALAPAPAGGR